MAEIRPLRDAADADIRRLIVGYETSERFDLTKTETPERTSITFELVPLDAPFTKRFPVSDEMIGWYRKGFDQGLSFGAYDGEVLVGLVIAQRQWNGIAIVWEMHVAESHRNQGIGRALLRTVEEAAAGMGLRAVSIETQTANVPAIRFYRACGYSVGAIDLSFYTNDDAERGEAAVFMKKSL